jgi:signal transduction histidine kinase
MIGFFSISSLVVIVGTVGFVNSLHIDSAFNVGTQRTLPQFLVLSDIESTVKKISSDIVGFALTSPAAKVLHQERLHELLQDNNTLARSVDQFGRMIAEDNKLVGSSTLLKNLTVAYSKVSLQLINSKISGMNDESILNLIVTADNIRNQINLVRNKLISVERDEVQNQIGEANNAIRTQQIEIIIASVAAFITSLVIGRHISQTSIIRPLLRLKEAAIQIARGNFDFEMKSYASPDEIGQLSTQFDTMRQMLNQRTGELESSNRQLSLANEQLKVHDRMQQDFINMAAHELRTPIQPLLLASSELTLRMPNEETISVIFRNANKLKDLANAILDVARIDSNSLQLYKERINLDKIIKSTLQEFKRSCGNAIAVQYEPKSVFLEADKDRITQVISNLLSNAVKFTKEGTISVSVKEGFNNQIIVSVADTGQGIDPEIVPRLFTRFATKSFDGTGLGLFISKKIVEAHGGKIWAENNHDGKQGATFSFSLPISS